MPWSGWQSVFFLSGYSIVSLLRLLTDANAALSCVWNTRRLQGRKGTESTLYRPLVSTAVLSYTLGLRHALDADHISVCTLWSNRQAHRFLNEKPGNRFDDSSAHSFRSTSGHCWDFLFSWSFHVRLFCCHRWQDSSF